MADTAHTPDKSETPAPVTPPAQLKVAAQLEMFVADICFWAGQDLNEKLPVAAIAEFSRGLAFIDWLHSMQDPNTKITYMGFVFDLNYGIMAVLRNIEPFTLNRFRRFVEVNRQRIENEDAAASNKEPDAKGNGKTKELPLRTWKAITGRVNAGSENQFSQAQVKYWATEHKWPMQHGKGKGHRPAILPSVVDKCTLTMINEIALARNDDGGKVDPKEILFRGGEKPSTRKERQDSQIGQVKRNMRSTGRLNKPSM